jgi:hypothetical protein
MLVLLYIYNVVLERAVDEVIASLGERLNSVGIAQHSRRSLEANVGRYNVAQHSRSLTTELLGGHVVPTENVSEGV